MGDTENTAAAGDSTDQASEFKAPASQEELNRIIQDRVARVKASYADYDDLKAKAAQVETFQSRIGELETANSELDGKVKEFETKAERAQIVSDVAKAKGVPASALRGNTREELEAHAADLAELLKPSAPVIHGQERTPDTIPDSAERQAVKSLFGNT
jgi:DNA repair exonuclease SbcCD ATPase subunit